MPHFEKISQRMWFCVRRAIRVLCPA